MGTLTIGQVAERTGFSTSALRYYEGIGLVVPAARSAAGYRLYDEAAVGRLAFIARAKQLGCTLEEITDLVSIWDGDLCGPVQRRFHDLITAKVGETQQRLDELTRFAGQLRSAAAQLRSEPVDGPCDDRCACLGEPVADPIACTLTAGEQRGRVQEWDDVLTHVTARTATVDGALRLALAPSVPLDELGRLVAAEQACCAFLGFTITVDATGTTLDVRAPTAAEPVVAALFGAAA